MMKAERMKIFVSVKRNLASMDLNANKPLLHRNQRLHILQGFTAVVLQILYLVYEASTAGEYMNSILMSMIGVLAHAAYWNVIFKTTAIYDFIENYERTINRSKLKINRFRVKEQIRSIHAIHRNSISDIECHLHENKRTDRTSLHVYISVHAIYCSARICIAQSSLLLLLVLQQ